jgi:hypothetical protein
MLICAKNRMKVQTIEDRNCLKNARFRDTPKVQEWLGHANIATI